MSTAEQFPPKGFHIVHGVDTPYGSMDMLEENLGLKSFIDLLAGNVDDDSGPEHQDPPAEI